MAKTRGIWRGVVPAVALVLAAGAGRSDPETPGPAMLVPLRAGLVIDRDVPAGWTGLALKSVPRLATGDLTSLPATARTLATLFRTVMLTEVAAGPGGGGGHVLKRVGLGLCSPLGGVDTVVSNSGEGGPADGLGFVERQVLAKAEEQLNLGRLAASTTTFALLVSPTVQKVGKSHGPIRVAYAFLVEPEGGRVRTLAWTLRGAESPGEVVEIAEGHVDDCAIDVAADRWLGAIPHDWSFAMNGLPAGRVIPVDARVGACCRVPRNGPVDAGRVENELRRLLKRVGPARPTKTGAGRVSARDQDRAVTVPASARVRASGPADRATKVSAPRSGVGNPSRS